jgi:long-chain acyl-CoA synthetase
VEQESFAASWERVRAARRCRPAIYSDQGGVLRTFGQIEEERAHWRTVLAGLSPSQTVVAQLGNDPGWPALFLACLDSSLVIVPIEPELSPPQRQRVIDLTGASALVEKTGISYLEGNIIQWPEPRPDMLKITSGTTGRPRAVRVREAHLLADCHNICRTMGIREEDVNFGVVPFSHSYGFSNLITPLFLQGTSLICASDRMPRALQQQVSSSRATVFPGTPTLFQALAALPDATSLGNIRLCISAGAPLPAEVSRLFHRRFNLRIHSFYGSSECGGIGYDRDGRLDQPTGFAGGPMDGVEVWKREDDRIAVSGANVADGYFPDPELATLDGRRFVPSDLIRWDRDMMQIYGRAADFINVAGKKFHPSTVEEHLRKLSGVFDAMVFGIPSPTRNEDLIAYIVSDQRVSRSQLEIHCRQGLNSWEIPRDFVIVDQLPVDARGKISRSELAARYMRGIANRK